MSEKLEKCIMPRGQGGRQEGGPSRPARSRKLRTGVSSALGSVKRLRFTYALPYLKVHDLLTL